MKQNIPQPTSTISACPEGKQHQKDATTHANLEAG
jgi:serine protease inhibitor ecotin